MNKFLTYLFGVLALLFGSLCAITSVYPVKASFLKENKKKTAGIMIGANSVKVKNTVGKIFSAVFPLAAIFKLKQIINDHKKANKRRKIMSAAGFAGVLLWLKSKKKKSGKRKLC